MRVLLKVVHKVRYRLAGGTIATYYYASAGSGSQPSLERRNLCVSILKPTPRESGRRTGP
jgi:hypothetical protein